MIVRRDDYVKVCHTRAVPVILLSTTAQPFSRVRMKRGTHGSPDLARSASALCLRRDTRSWDSGPMAEAPAQGFEAFSGKGQNVNVLG